MKRSTWINSLKDQYVSFLGMSEFEANKAAVIAADHARGPWDAERIVVPEVVQVPIVGSQGKGYLRGRAGDLTAVEANRAAGILDGFEAARSSFSAVDGNLHGPDDLKRLRAFFQIEEGK